MKLDTMSGYDFVEGLNEGEQLSPCETDAVIHT